MVWLWINPPEEKGYPYANFDDKFSKIPSSSIAVSINRLSPTLVSDIVVNIESSSAHSVSEFACLPNALRCPLVNHVIGAYINRLVGNDMEMLPVTAKVRKKIHSIGQYSYAHCLFQIKGLDLQKSIIDSWLVPGEIVHQFTRLVFRPDCLKGRHFARDRQTGRIVVSEELRNTLLLTGDLGLCFVRPEDVLEY